MADNISLIVNETIDNVVINPSITTEVVDVNVTGTDTYVDISVTPNLTTVNINRQVPVGVNGQDLQSVTDIGATTTNGITITVGDGDGNGISSTSSQGYGVYGSSNETYGVYGSSSSSAGVYGIGGIGVYGESTNGNGVEGVSVDGNAIYGSSANVIGVYARSDYGTGLYGYTEDGVAISVQSNAIGLEVNGNGTIAIEANLGNSNKGLVINSGTSSTGNFIELDKNGVDKLVVNQQGELTATKLIKQGGTSSQFLMADGSVSTGGGGGGATNLSPSQTATNFTINSDTGTDATIPLGNGTLAGATLNDYTTAEKNKLSAITGTNTGDQDLQDVTDIGATTTNTITANSITTTIDSTINGVRVGRGNIADPISLSTAVGYQALQSVLHTTGDTGYYNSAFGDQALKSLTTGSYNDAFGTWALRLCTEGTYNTAIGSGALMNLTTGSNNTAIGVGAHQNNIIGERNTAIGIVALNRNTGSNNTAIGYYAGGLATSSGNWNILVGMQAGRDITTGSNNLLIENITNASITSGSFNIVLNPKQKSGVTTGSYNTIIGAFDGTFPSAMANNVILADGQGNIRFRTTETGLTTVPAQTNTLINGDATGKSVITKEYLTNSQTGFVPYTGATTDVNLGLNDITAAKLIKDGGFDYQFLKADGSVDNNIYLTSADLPSTLDLYATTTASDISGYTVLVRNIADTRYNATAVDVSTGVITSVGQLVGSLVTDANIISGNPGVFDFKTIGNISRTNGTGQAEFFFRIYKRNLAGTETLIAESDYTLPVTNGGYVEFSATALWNDGIFLDTDRVVLKYYANRLTSPVGSDPTYQFQFGGSSPVRSSAAIPTSVMPNIYLRDLADVENVDALNNEILYWNDSASLWEHSLAENLVPLATATQKGLVSTTTQTFAGDKTFTGAIGASNLSGTNTGDNATNTQYSGLAASKQDTLQNTVNIKSINGNSLLGSGDLTISGTGISSLNGLTGATQTFSILTNFTGSPSFVSTGTNHQLRLPNASPSTDYGLITNGSQFIGGTKVFTSNPEIPVPAGNSGSCIVLGTTGGGGATGTLQIGSTTLYPTALEMQYVKGITSSVQTQLDSKASIFANITNNVYSGTIVWTGGAAPTVPNHTYSLSQIGNLVTLTINLAYTTAGSSLLTGVAMELPSTAPAPALPSSATAALDVINYGSGALQILNGSPTAAFATNTLLRIKSTGVYEVFITRGAGQYRHAYATIQYFV